jgi:hypothetical protein
MGGDRLIVERGWVCGSHLLINYQSRRRAPILNIHRPPPRQISIRGGVFVVGSDFLTVLFLPRLRCGFNGSVTVARICAAVCSNDSPY